MSYNSKQLSIDRANKKAEALKDFFKTTENSYAYNELKKIIELYNRD